MTVADSLLDFRNRLHSLIHDLNNVLNAVMAHSYEADEKTKGVLEDCVALGSAITKEMAECVGTTSSATPLPRRVAEQVTAVREMLPALQKGFNIEILLSDCTKSDCSVVVTKEFLLTIVRNLVANASKAGASSIRIAFREHGDRWVQIVVADDGCGMSPEEVENLNKPSLDVSGVTIVRNLVYAAAGIVHWESRPCVGTWVTITLARFKGD